MQQFIDREVMILRLKKQLTERDKIIEKLREYALEHWVTNEMWDAMIKEIKGE